MPIVRANSTRQLREFYPPPYAFLGPRARARGMGQDEAVSDVTSAVGAAAGIAAVIPGGQLVGAALALGATLTAILAKVFSGCGQKCTLTSDAANKVEQVLSQNVHLYVGTPAASRTQSFQAACLQVFDNAWSQLEQYCGQTSFGSAGQNCISDRQQGSCAYKTSPGGWQQQSDGSYQYVWPGANGSGSTCWNWFVGYRDPIANDPAVQPDTVASSVSSAFGSLLPAGTNLSSLLLPGALILGGVVLVMSLD